MTAATSRVLEALVGHHVAPVTRRVADRQHDRLVVVAGPRTPRRPTGTSRPGCRRAGAGTERSRRESVGHPCDGTPARCRAAWPWPSGSRACPTATARRCRRGRRRAAPCSRRERRGVTTERVERRRVRPGRGCTTATTRSPHRSSGTPTTTASNTAGCAFSAASTSSGYTFSPPVLIDTEPRPRSVIVPSASIRAWSPGTDHRTPSTTGKVAAVFSGSL